MIVKLLKDPNLNDDYIDIQYRELTFTINQIIDLAESERPYLLVKKDNSEYQIDLQDVYYFETVDKKYFLYTKEDVYETELSLRELEDLLNEYGFIRINRSMIINTLRVHQLKSDLNMRILAILDNGEHIKVTRHYRKQFYQSLKRLSIDIKEGK